MYKHRLTKALRSPAVVLGIVFAIILSVTVFWANQSSTGHGEVEIIETETVGQDQESLEEAAAREQEVAREEALEQERLAAEALEAERVRAEWEAAAGYAAEVERLEALERERLEALERSRQTTTTTTAPPIATTPDPVVQTGGSGCVLPDYICERESRHSYTAYNASSGAGGMYQFIPSTWNGIASQIAPEWVGTPPHLAPPHVQDQFAAHLWAGGAGACHWAGGSYCG